MLLRHDLQPLRRVRPLHGVHLRALLLLLNIVATVRPWHLTLVWPTIWRRTVVGLRQKSVVFVVESARAAELRPDDVAEVLERVFVVELELLLIAWNVFLRRHRRSGKIS